MSRLVCATIDLDPLRCYFDNRGLRPGPQTHLNAVYDDGLPRFLATFERLQIPATFFAVGEDAVSEENAARLATAVGQGHEIANHSFSHPASFAALDSAALDREIDQAERALQTATGVTVRGFRAPSWNVHPRLFETLLARGYRYDSTLVPLPASRLWSSLSRSWPSTFGGSLFAEQGQWPRPPAHPYRLNRLRPWREDRASKLWEVPNGLTGGLVPLPLSATALALLGARAERLVARWAARRAEPLVLVFHGADLVDFHAHIRDQRLRSKPGLAAAITTKQKRIEGLLRAFGAGRRWTRLDDLVAECEAATT